MSARLLFLVLLASSACLGVGDVKVSPVSTAGGGGKTSGGAGAASAGRSSAGSGGSGLTEAGAGGEAGSP